MRVVLFRRHGGPDVLEYTDFPKPDIKSGEALIRLRAAALNRMDIMVRNGWSGLSLEMPHINGADGAGIVESISEESENFQVGDHVVINANLGCGDCDFCKSGRDNMCLNWHLLGETIRGTYAEYVSLPVKQLYKLPGRFDFHNACAAALVYQTAWHSLSTRGNIQNGETVLIVGAGGGVNSACIQVAKYLGARVIVIGSGPRKLAGAEKLGADVLIDRSKKENWSKEVYLLTKKRGVDAVIDNVGVTFMQSLRTLRKGGRLLTVGNSGSPIFELDNRYIFAKHLSIIGSTMSTRDEFNYVMDLITTDKLSPVLDSTFPLQEAAIAQERLWKNENFGKITLDIS